MGEVSQLAKAAGYIVSLVPPQSYLDYDTRNFDQSVLHAPSWEPTFRYQGYNTYAPVLAKYGTTSVIRNGQLEAVPTWDFISIQLYETYSRANNEINNLKVPVATYLAELVQEMNSGWEVDFTNDPQIGLKTQNVSVPHSQLVIGFANAWAGPRPGKTLLVYPDEAQTAWEELVAKNMQPKGFMFWDIQDEGKDVDGKPFYLSKGLNNFLKIR
jgi:hypothetical protein